MGIVNYNYYKMKINGIKSIWAMAVAMMHSHAVNALE